MYSPMKNLKDVSVAALNERQLNKFQREYKRLLLLRPDKTELTARSNFLKNLNHVLYERHNIRLDLRVLRNSVYLKLDEMQTEFVGAQVKCQEEINEDVQLMREEINALEAQIKRTDKELSEKMKLAKSEKQYMEHVMKMRNRISNLENRLETNRKRAASYLAENTRLRQQIIDQLYARKLFNRLWKKLINRLSRDQKYLIDLIEYAMEAFNNCIDIYQRLNAIDAKGHREMENCRQEMQNIIRQMNSDLESSEFLKVKSKYRKMEDLEPREYKRREIFKEMRENKIQVYHDALETLLSFTGLESITDALKKFNKQENIYYSYFQYTNELQSYITRLNEGINELYGTIDGLKTNNNRQIDTDLQLIRDLRAEFATEEAAAALKKEERAEKENNLKVLLQGIQTIFFKLRCDDSILRSLLGDHTKVTKFNVYRFLKILEDRLNSILSHVYVSQRAEGAKGEDFTVRSNVKDRTKPTHIDAIVLAQQCAQCAEGEEVNPYDVAYVAPLTRGEVKEKIREKVLAPEMQYRLHALEECKLPRSRILADSLKKN